MSRLVPLLSSLLLAGCFPEVPMEYGKDGLTSSDTGTATTPDGTDPQDPDEDGDGVPASEDCDDTDATISPGADEVCDGVDNDCDGVIDPDDAADAAEWFPDSDGDGFGSGLGGRACTPPSDSAPNDLDCDDADAAVHPDSSEACDGIDNDCDGMIDDADDSLDPASRTAFYADTDDDGFGTPSDVTEACDLPTGHVVDATDCDDLDPAVHPDASEVCDDVDNDCDGLVDADDDSVDPATWRTFYEDLDADGYGSSSGGREACSTPVGAAASGDDCDDTNPAVNPAAVEVCDAADVDEDCDGLVDDADPSVDLSAAGLWYTDADADGFGDTSATGLLACDDPSDASGRFAPTADDCDDTTAAVHPGATEVCDAADVDEDCDGLADDADSSTDTATMSKWLPDADGDTYGDASGTALTACDDPSTSSAPYVSSSDDCDDSDPAIHPGATEVCDADDVDEDCDGLSDDADPSLDTSTASAWYVDADGDGFGDDSATATPWCDDPASGYATTADDCDDTDSAIHPSATEVCDFADNDCDPTTGQAGMARFVAASGTETDLATTLGAGTSSAPIAWSAPSDGTLWICEDTWYVNLEVSWDALDVVGPDGAALTVLDGAAAGPVVDASWFADLFLADVTLRNGGADNGGGIHAEYSTVEAEGVHFEDNLAVDDGGGLYAVDSAVTLTDCAFDGNEAIRHGGGLAVDGDGTWRGIELDGCTFTDNYAAEHGGGIHITGDADVELTDTVLTDNLADKDGGGLYHGSGVLTLDSCTVDLNLSDDDGGGAYIKDTFTADDTTFDGNSATDDGGGIYFDLDRNEDAVLQGTLTGSASSTSVSGNAAGDRGSGLVVKIDDDRSSGTLDVDTVDFGSDEVFHDTDNNDTLTPGDGASFYCDYAGDCR